MKIQHRINEHVWVKINEIFYCLPIKAIKLFNGAIYYYLEPQDFPTRWFEQEEIKEQLHEKPIALHITGNDLVKTIRRK